jgi:hypothetical protein|nr:MAG TPA: hypothetical protein [Caudoviricetes sp.]
MLKTQLITKIPLEAPVNQCQGFCYDTKRQKFVIATISSDNQTQDIMRVCTDCGTVVYKKRFNDKPRLGHMNTLSYRDDLDVIYTTNATVDGFLLTVLDAETFEIKETIKMPHKVFNVAYDQFTHTFISVRPYKKNIRLIQEYTCEYGDITPRFSHQYELDCVNEDFNNNGCLLRGDKLMFATLTDFVVYDIFTKERQMYAIDKNIEPEDFDYVRKELYCAVYRPKHQVEIHKVIEPQFVR